MASCISIECLGIEGVKWELFRGFCFVLYAVVAQAAEKQKNRHSRAPVKLRTVSTLQ